MVFQVILGNSTEMSCKLLLFPISHWKKKHIISMYTHTHSDTHARTHTHTQTFLKLGYYNMAPKRMGFIVGSFSTSSFVLSDKVFTLVNYTFLGAGSTSLYNATG